VLSLVFPARETFMEKAVLADDFLAGLSQGSSMHRDVVEKGDLEFSAKAV